MTTRKYSSVSQETTLTSALNSSATTMVVASSTAVLGGITLANTSPLETFVVVIDPDTALEEIVEVTYPSSTGSNTLTIVRGRDGTTGISHSAGAKIRHMAIGRDFRESNTHIEASSGVHGITGSVVGTTDTQTLTNKTFTAPVITSLSLGDGSIVFEGATADSYETTLSVAEPTADRTVTIPDATTTLVGTDTTQTLTNKTLTSPKINENVAVTATATELNILDGVTASTAELNILDGVTSTAAELNILDGVTSTAAELNILDGATLTVTELNYVDGVTSAIQTQLDSKAPTASPTFTGTVTLPSGTVTSTMILDGTIVNGDINASAQIAYSKTNLTNSIVNADINASAAIEWTKIAPSSTVSATELGYLDGVTSAVQTQLDGKLSTSTASSTYAPIASPTFTGVPAAPTATAGTSTTQVATTAFVGTAINNLIDGAPTTLDTLNEIAAALADTANFSDTVVLKAGSTMSGNLAMGTNKVTGLGTPSASTDAATKGYVDTVTVAPSNLTGPITSVGAATSVAAQTGTGSTFVMNTSPTLVTPVLGVATATSINGTSIPSSKTLVATDSTTYVVPSQSGNSGKYLTTNGTNSSWGTVDALPSQTSNSGKYLTTDGTTASWATVTTDPTADIFMMMGA